MSFEIDFQYIQQGIAKDESINYLRTFIILAWRMSSERLFLLFKNNCNVNKSKCAVAICGSIFVFQVPVS